MLWSVLRIAVAVYVIFGVILLVFQRRFVYFPHREIEMTPRQVGLKYEDVSFQAADGVELTGWFVPATADKPAGVVLFCHGNAGNISHRLPTLELFHELGFSTFIFDYRGYGGSRGKPTEKGIRLDAEAAWRHLVEARGVAPERIILFGRSLGGAVAARLAADKKPAGLVMESTFTSIPDLAARIYRVYPVGLMARDRHDALKCLERVSCPVLVAHSRDDDMIPFAHGRRLYEAAGEPKQFLALRGRHNDPPTAAEGSYRDALANFLSTCLGE